MLWLLEHLDLSVPKENTALSPITWTAVPTMLSISFSCKPCSKQYTGSTGSFRYRFNNYKLAHRNFFKGNTVKQASFHAHFEDDKHGMSDWEITLSYQTGSIDDLRRRGSFWQCELHTFQPNELKELDLALSWCIYILNLYIVFIFSEK